MSVAIGHDKQEAGEGYELLLKKDVSSENDDTLTVPPRQLPSVSFPDDDSDEVRHT